MGKNKTPLMLYVTKETKKLIDKIDLNDFLGLSNQNTSRTELFMFASALGLEVDMQTNLDSKDSLIRVNYLQTKDEALIYSSFINNIQDEENLEECVLKSEVFSQIEKYANTGFNLLQGMMESKNEEFAIFERIKELDQKYEECFND